VLYDCTFGWEWTNVTGYLDILLSDTDYLALARVAFIPLDNPIDLPTFTTHNAPNESIFLEYNTAVEAYETYLLMQSMLKAQIPPDNPIELPTFTTRNAPNESICLEYNAAVEAYETYLLMQSTLKAWARPPYEHWFSWTLVNSSF
jgi:hypothetical protein